MISPMYQAHDAISSAPVGVKHQDQEDAEDDASLQKRITGRDAYVLKMEVVFKTGDDHEQG